MMLRYQAFHHERLIVNSTGPADQTSGKAFDAKTKKRDGLSGFKQLNDLFTAGLKMSI